MKRGIFLLVFSVTVLSLSAQRYGRWRRMRYEVIYAVGGTNFLGELGGANREGSDFLRDFEVSQTRPLVQIGMRYKLYRDLAVKGALTVGYLHGDDATTTEPFRQHRNLRFRTPIIEFATQIEYSIFTEKIGHRYSLRRIRGLRGFKANLYVFTGIAAFWFNPQGKYNGKWYNLQPLGTEGQGLIPTRPKYHRLQPSIPYGIGVKYGLDRRWSIGLEFGVRKTFTDYIDDVSTTYYSGDAIRDAYGQEAAGLADPSISQTQNEVGWTAAGQQRGDATDNDTYMFMTINMVYKLRQTRRGFPKFR